MVVDLSKLQEECVYCFRGDYSKGELDIEINPKYYNKYKKEYSEFKDHYYFKWGQDTDYPTFIYAMPYIIDFCQSGVCYWTKRFLADECIRRLKLTFWLD